MKAIFMIGLIGYTLTSFAIASTPRYSDRVISRHPVYVSDCMIDFSKKITRVRQVGATLYLDERDYVRSSSRWFFSVLIKETKQIWLTDDGKIIESSKKIETNETFDRHYSDSSVDHTGNPDLDLEESNRLAKAQCETQREAHQNQIEQLEHPSAVVSSERVSGKEVVTGTRLGSRRGSAEQR